MRTLGLIFVYYFSLAALFIATIWTLFFINFDGHGEMVDGIFFLAWSVISLLTIIMWVWTFRLHRRRDDPDIVTKLQYVIISVIGVLPTLICIMTFVSMM